ncbi:winged helix-turn-helix transcriptional regulator [Halorussus sp. AFM4]|uniref:winged helix-turn-helix transcriptional regulator n=1 Tax=Halorussus sp. AFM4 TaxID=3421651 RepID=UPI003EBDF74B
MSNPTRTRLQSHIETHPGQHFNALVRDLDLAPGQVQYHIQRLCTEDAVVQAEYYGKTHYYPPEIGEWERGVLALARRETARDVMFDLLEHSPCSPSEVAERVGIARSTLEWHLDHLVEQNIVHKQRDHRNRVTLELTEPEQTVELLNTIEPSLPARLVDRFERLVDQLLGE